MVRTPLADPPPKQQLPRTHVGDGLKLTTHLHSGIFGYINYLVEKDRKYILNTLINGESCERGELPRSLFSSTPNLGTANEKANHTQASHV